MKVLIIEDDKELTQLLENALKKEGLVVEICSDGEAGLELAKQNKYDCILLDINLPKIDGLTVAKELRKESNTTPILMVTGRTKIPDRLIGFGTGADDYITKPFDFQELVARIKAIIRRNSINKLDKLKFVNYELIPEQNLVVCCKGRKGKKEIVLSSKEAGILEYLIRNKGRIVSTEELLEHVWDREVDIFTDTVKTHIKTLRKKIDPEKKIIKTVRGKGYLVS